MAEMRYIQPDSFDISLIVQGKLRRCPFCGDGLAAIVNRTNEDTKVFRSVISCSKCDAQAGYNARDLDEARQGVIKRWNTRAAD
jgi:Lar family restriction alleviation protein